MADQNIKYRVTTTGTEKAVASFKNLAGAIGLAFGTQQVIRFATEAVKLSAKAEGIATAFERLGRPGLLDNLRRATRETVDNVTLMQKAVQASNFKIPLEQLATFFEFATKRAIQTGESVDYLVESIITGIGRKSVLVMDNLGISAVELQEEVKRIGDFGQAAGNIIRRELGSMGDVADTTATKFARISTFVTDIQKTVGDDIVRAFSWWEQEIKATIELFEDLAEAVADVERFLGVGSPRGIDGGLREGRELSQQFLNNFKKVVPVTVEVKGEVQKINEEIIRLVELNKAMLTGPGSLADYKANLQAILALEKLLTIEKEKQAKTFRTKDIVGLSARGVEGVAPVGGVVVPPQPLIPWDKIEQDGKTAGEGVFQSWAVVLTNNMNEAWLKIFGEANSLFEQLIQQMANMLVNNIFSSLLSFLPGGSILSGITSLFSSPTSGGGSRGTGTNQPILIQIGDVPFAEAMIRGNRVIQQRRLI